MKEKINTIKVIIETTNPKSRAEFDFIFNKLDSKEVFQKLNEHFDFLKSVKLK